MAKDLIFAVDTSEIVDGAGLDARSKSTPAVSKLLKVWENRQAQQAARVGGFGLMAVSLAACGGSSETDDADDTDDDVEVPVGQSFVLTTGIDSGSTFVGTSSNDTYDGTKGAAGALTLTALDNIDGGAGTDTLNVSAVGAVSITSNVTVNNIEVANITSSAALDVDAAAWTGLTTLTTSSVGGNVVVAQSTTDVTVADSNLAAAAITVDAAKDVTISASKVTTGTVDVGVATAVAGAVNVTTNLINGAVAGDINVVGGTTVAVSQNVAAGALVAATTADVDVTNGGALTSVTSTVNIGTGATVTTKTVTVNGLGSADDADTITSISVTGATTLTTANTNALASLSLATTSGNITIDNGDAGNEQTTLALTVNGVTGGTLDDDDIYTTINITSTGTASTLAKERLKNLPLST